MMFAWHLGQLSRVATQFAHLSQKCVKPSHDVARNTSKQSDSVAVALSAVGSGATDVVVCAIDWMSLSLLQL